MAQCAILNSYRAYQISQVNITNTKFYDDKSLLYMYKVFVSYISFIASFYALGIPNTEVNLNKSEFVNGKFCHEPNGCYADCDQTMYFQVICYFLTYHINSI